METLQQPKTVTARKKHHCEYCGKPIEQGSLYNRSTHKDEGILYTWKSHTYCAELVDKLNMWENADDGIDMDWFITDVRERHMDLVQNREHVKFDIAFKYVLDHYSISHNLI